MKHIRKRITYANVMSSIAIFVVLGGAAYAATKLPKKSVGAPQLKSNAVTTAKIKKNAVTSTKIKNGTVKGEDINIGSTPFSRVVAKLRTGGPLNATGALQNYPLSPSTYTQGAEEDDTYMGAVDVTFQASCEAPRHVLAIALVDAPKPTEPFGEEEEKIVALGNVEDESVGTVSRRVELGPFVFLGTRFEPGAPTTRTVNLVVEGKCKTGSGITANAGAIDVIGTK